MERTIDVWRIWTGPCGVADAAAAFRAAPGVVRVTEGTEHIIVSIRAGYDPRAWRHDDAAPSIVRAYVAPGPRGYLEHLGRIVDVVGARGAGGAGCACEACDPEGAR